MQFLRIIFWLICSVIPSVTLAENRAFHEITMGDGLSDLLVNAIYKDSVGFVWIGTDNCLDRFDGNTIKHFYFTSSSSQHKRVNAILETNKEYLWVGNEQGLWRLNRYTEKMEQFAPETINFAVYGLFYNKHALYIGTERGLYIYEHDKLTHLLVNPNVLSAENQIRGIVADRDDLIWMFNSNSILSFNVSTKQFSTYTPQLGSKNTLRCATMLGDVLYVGTGTYGIFCFNILDQQYADFVDVGCNIISSISNDENDVIHVATDGNGVHFVSASRKTIIESFCHNSRDKSTIPSNSVYSLLVDRDDIIWFGFYQSGFAFSIHQNGLFSTYAYPPHFNSSGKQVRSFLIHDQKKIIGTRDGLFYIDEAKQIVKDFYAPTLRANLILSIHYYEGEYYIGTYGGGLSILNPATLSLHDFKKSNSAVFYREHIFCMCTDSSGNLWFGTSDGIYHLNKETDEVKHYTHINSHLPEGNVYHIFFDSTNKGWIGTENGLCIYDPQTTSFKTNVFPEGFIHKEKVRVIYEDSSHHLFFLPDKGSILCSNLNMSRFLEISIPSFLNANSFMSIVEDEEGWLWLGCDGGLLRCRIEDQNYSAYGFNDGIPTPTFTNNAAYRDDSGTIWLGNAKGLLSVSPKQLNDFIRNPYPIVITDILIDGESIEASTRLEAVAKGKIQLSKHENNISFDFTSLSYTNPMNLSYEYMLEGFDSKWKSLIDTNRASYYNLPSGNYSFKIRIPGEKSSEVNLNVNIQSTFTTRTWIVSFLLLFTILYLVYRIWILRRKHSFSHSTPLVSEESQKTEQNKEIEEKYKTIRLSNEECVRLVEKLNQVMKDSKLYINPELKIAEVARAIGVSSHSLSYLFNQYLNQSYYDYINQYRVAEFKHMIDNKLYPHYTLSSLAELCGFSSRASFFRSFKKITGVTPSEYMKRTTMTEDDIQ